MIEITVKMLVQDLRTGEQKEVEHLTGLLGQIETTIQKLAMQDCLLNARINGQRVLRITKITAILEHDLYPQDFPALNL